MLVQAGLNPSAKAFFTFYAVVICEALAASALGFVISAGCKVRLTAMNGPESLSCLEFTLHLSTHRTTVPT